jgi:hypothetical protein
MALLWVCLRSVCITVAYDSRHAHSLASGGISLACAHSLLINIFEALIVGGVGAGCGYLGLRYITPIMNQRTRIPVG